MKRIITILLIVTLSTYSLYAAGEQPSSWAKEVVATVFAEQLVDDRMQGNYQDAITRRDFAYLGVVIYESITGKTSSAGEQSFPDSDDEYVLRAKNVGVVNGYDDGTFRPDQAITRQELAVLFINTLAAANQSLEIGEREIFFDDEAVAGWAKKSVYTARALGVVQGVGDNLYEPLGTATREQALLMFKRVIDKYALAKPVQPADGDQPADAEKPTDEEKPADDGQPADNAAQQATQPTAAAKPVDNGQLPVMKVPQNIVVSDFSVNAYGGTTFNFGDYRAKPVVFSFFTTSCQPCLDQLVTLTAAHEAARDDFNFVAVNLTQLDDGAALQQTVARYAIDYPILLDDGTLMKAYRVTALPTTVIVSGDRVVAYYVGAMTAEQLASLLDAHR